MVIKITQAAPTVGSSGEEGAADVVIHVVGQRWATTKYRYGVPLTGDVGGGA